MGTFLALDQAPAIMGTLFILDLARHLFIRQKPRFILFIMPSLGPIICVGFAWAWLFGFGPVA